MTTNLKKAVIYCRVSTKEQVDEGNSLITQEKICNEYALKNGFEVVKVFIEEGESAKTANRTELQKLLQFCADKKNAVTAIIAYKIDRISRNTDDYSQIRILLKRYGVEIKSTSEYFEDTPAGRFMENIIANVAQFDNDVRTERSINGMREACREGRYVWTAPVGYSNIKVGGKATIAQNDLAPFVRKAFELVARNRHIEDVRKQIIKRGLIGKSGKPLSKSQFYAMFNNEVYCGWIFKFGEKHKGLFEPIVSEELFNTVQLVLNNRAKRTYVYTLENPDFPLRRFVRHITGTKLTGSWSKGRSKRYPYYRFIRERLEYKKDDFEKKFKNFLNRYSISDEDYKYLKQAIKENLCKALEDKSKEAKKLQAYVTELKERQSAVIQKNLRGVISDFILQEQLALIESEIRNAEAILSTLPNENANYLESLEIAKAYLKEPSKIWSIAPFEEKLKLQWFEFPQGIIFTGNNFRTVELASIYKAKNFFFAQKSYRAPSVNENTNHIKENVPAFYWQHIGEDVKALAEIVSRIKSDK